MKLAMLGQANKAAQFWQELPCGCTELQEEGEQKPAH